MVKPPASTDGLLRTPRLVLRRWLATDVEPFAAMNADPLTMRFMPGVLTRGETEALVARFEAHHGLHGFGVWALEVPGVAPFIGYTGLQRVGFDAPFAPAVEIGWRLAPAHWGKGYATEAAREALRTGFEDLNLDQIVSFTVAANRPSWAVMERLGMTRDADGGFEHPRLPRGHPLRPHILYRISRAAWLRLRGS
ncbi:MAG: GNAT family N-acetyltransferase [Alphaproteobacteria bacterium]|nr:GNAT family N-acetyltransferase [Alphaproteobacteria bacterium]